MEAIGARKRVFVLTVSPVGRAGFARVEERGARKGNASIDSSRYPKLELVQEVA